MFIFSVIFLFQDFTPTERDGRGGVGAFIGYKDYTPTELNDKQYASIQTVNHLLQTIDHRLLTIYPQDLVDHRNMLRSESRSGVDAEEVVGEAGDLHVVYDDEMGWGSLLEVFFDL